MAYSVVFLYELIKDPGYRGKKETCKSLKSKYVLADLIPLEESGPWGRPNRWSLARSLWESGSDFDFFRLWKEKPHFIITNHSLEHFVGHGKGEDVDEFAEIILGVSVERNPFDVELC